MNRVARYVEERPWAAGLLAFSAVAVWWADIAKMSAAGWF